LLTHLKFKVKVLPVSADKNNMNGATKMIMVSDIANKMTFILEPARKGSKKLNASCMTATGRDGDVKIAFARVPLYIRRAARAAFSA
jgi:hypothetical protein